MQTQTETLRDARYNDMAQTPETAAIVLAAKTIRDGYRGSGIGRAVAVHFAREGADVAIVYLQDTDEAEETRRLVEREGRTCVLFKGDVSDEGYARQTVHEAHRQLGRLDILVNNAAVQFPHQDFSEITTDEFRKTFEVNIFFVLLFHAGSPQIHSRRRLHHQYGFGDGLQGQPDAGGLLLDQGRDCGLYAGVGGATGFQKHPGERRGSRPHLDSAHPRIVWRENGFRAGYAHGPRRRPGRGGSGLRVSGRPFALPPMGESGRFGLFKRYYFRAAFAPGFTWHWQVAPLHGFLAGPAENTGMYRAGGLEGLSNPVATAVPRGFFGKPLPQKVARVFKRNVANHTLAMTSITKDQLDLYEIQDGVFVCEDSGQVMRWLRRYAGNFGSPAAGQNTVLAAVTHENAAFHVRFIVREMHRGQPLCWMLYVPNYLSKHFNLQCFGHCCPETNVPALFRAMLVQFQELIRSNGFTLPVCGYCHPEFTGFVYDTERLLNEN